MASPKPKYWSVCLFCCAKFKEPIKLVKHMRETHTEYAGLELKPETADKIPRRMDKYCCRRCSKVVATRRLSELGRDTKAGESKHKCFNVMNEGQILDFNVFCVVVGVKFARELVTPYFPSVPLAHAACTTLLPAADPECSEFYDIIPRLDTMSVSDLNLKRKIRVTGYDSLREYFNDANIGTPAYDPVMYPIKPNRQPDPDSDESSTDSDELDAPSAVNDKLLPNAPSTVSDELLSNAPSIDNDSPSLNPLSQDSPLKKKRGFQPTDVGTNKPGVSTATSPAGNTRKRTKSAQPTMAERKIKPNSGKKMRVEHELLNVSMFKGGKRNKKTDVVISDSDDSSKTSPLPQSNWMKEADAKLKSTKKTSPGAKKKNKPSGGKSGSKPKKLKETPSPLKEPKPKKLKETPSPLKGTLSDFSPAPSLPAHRSTEYLSSPDHDLDKLWEQAKMDAEKGCVSPRLQTVPAQTAEEEELKRAKAVKAANEAEKAAKREAEKTAAEQEKIREAEIAKEAEEEQEKIKNAKVELKKNRAAEEAAEQERKRKAKAEEEKLKQVQAEEADKRERKRKAKEEELKQAQAEEAAEQERKRKVKAEEEELKQAQAKEAKRKAKEDDEKDKVKSTEKDPKSKEKLDKDPKLKEKLAKDKIKNTEKDPKLKGKSRGEKTQDELDRENKKKRDLEDETERRDQYYAQLIEKDKITTNKRRKSILAARKSKQQAKQELQLGLLKSECLRQKKQIEDKREIVWKNRIQNQLNQLRDLKMINESLDARPQPITVVEGISRMLQSSASLGAPPAERVDILNAPPAEGVDIMNVPLDTVTLPAMGHLPFAQNISQSQGLQTPTRDESPHTCINICEKCKQDKQCMTCSRKDCPSCKLPLTCNNCTGDNSEDLICNFHKGVAKRCMVCMPCVRCRYPQPTKLIPADQMAIDLAWIYNAPVTHNIKHLVVVNHVLPATEIQQCRNKAGHDIFLIPAVSCLTGEFVVLEAPITVGSPQAVFRDLKEHYIPYMPHVVREFPDCLRTSRHHIELLTVRRSLGQNRRSGASSSESKPKQSKTERKPLE